MSALLAGIAGLVCGVFSGLGIGGGTLLMVWMTAVMDMEQRMAQGINLLYFLPTAACALIFHIKNRLIRWRVVIPAAIAGCLTAAGAALLATAIDASLLRKLFGGFLILVGLNEIFGSHARDRKDK
ncbi:MAG: sulfite exporter TauE/SafE family protein [Firmicutes bacterium]|nr:sulfite exporter TauE/SafE family protein [Bacillota bacterium]